MESLISNIWSHEMKLLGYESVKKSKSHSLKFVDQPVKSSKVQKFEEPTHAGGYEEDLEDEEMELLSRNFSIWPIRITKYSQEEAMASQGQAPESKKLTRWDALNTKSLVTLWLIVQSCRRTSQRKEAFRIKTLETRSRRVVTKWDEFDKEVESDEDEEGEANLALMASTSSNAESDLVSG